MNSNAEKKTEAKRESELCIHCSFCIPLTDTPIKSPKPKKVHSQDQVMNEGEDTVTTADILKVVNALLNRFSALEQKISMNVCEELKGVEMKVKENEENVKKSLKPGYRTATKKRGCRAVQELEP